MAEEMEKRQDRLEWEVGVLKERYDHMDDRIGEMSIRMDQQHRELLAAIDSLKDDRARAEGVEAAEMKVAQRDRDRMRAMGIVIAILGLMALAGWVAKMPGRIQSHRENADMKNVTLQTRSLFISAGHSDTDPGATGNGFTEADVVLEFRDMLGDALRRRGIVFDKDGTPGCNLPLRDAVGAAKTHDIAVEFHCNAFSNPAASGVETLSERQHYSLGESICNAIAGVLGINNRGAKGEDSGQHSRLAFIRDGGGVIVELFFITNKSDLSTYLANKHRVVDAVADVLTDADP